MLTDPLDPPAATGSVPNIPAERAADHQTADRKTPLVTLWLPKVKSTKAVAVYGGSGKKYLFQRSVAAQGRPARSYFDTATFETEESDIRANLRHIYAVCTLLTPSEPAAPATETVEEPSAPALPATDATPSSPSPLPLASSSDAPAKVWPPKESYTEAQLHEMPMEDLRALAAHYQVPGAFRREIVRAWGKRS